jgi:hypothetical protein
MKGGDSMKKIFKIGAMLGGSFLYAMAALATSHGIGQLGIEYGTATGLGTQDVRSTIAQIINVALGLLGIVAVVIIVAGGFMWMTSGGSEEKVGTAKNMIFAGVIGLAIILSAYAIAQFVISQLITATQ